MRRASSRPICKSCWHAATWAQALEGVGGLVEYPYGCVEQTMSRFLPAVAVKDATRHAPIGLPPDVAARLPDVLAKGLARLYAFQHDDGGWGWWEHDATDDRMTTYVVHGLARCRVAGVAVSEGRWPRLHLSPRPAARRQARRAAGCARVAGPGAGRVCGYPGTAKGGAPRS
jgi:uncharacterized protein YfaS (alpha-2-macroglobulin family)